MGQIKRTRMYEPWGYRDENNYMGTEIIHENDLYSFFAGTEYNKDDGFIYFTNKDGDEVGKLDTSEFIKDDKIVERAYYDHDTQSIIIEFTNGDKITVPVEDIIDENEFEDGLIINDHIVKVLIDPTTERWLTVSIDGVKVSGIQAEIDRLDERIDNEIARATSEETRIEAKLDQEIQDRIDDVDAEETRATSEEARIEGKLDVEITRSKDADDDLDRRIGILNDGLTSERSIREANDIALGNRISTETTNRKTEAVVSAEYNSGTTTIDFKNASGNVISQIDATPFITDGMIDRVYVDNETQELVIVWNSTPGKEETRIPLSSIFNPDDYYTKQDIDDKFYDKAEINSTFATVSDNINGEITARESGDNALDVKIEALTAVVDAKANTSDVDDALALKADASAIADMATQTWVGEQGFLTEHQDLSEYAKTSDVNAALDLKADKTEIPTDFYTQEEVDALLAAKESEIFSLKKIVGEMGGNVTYEYPTEGTLTSLMGNNGTVKLTEDATISRLGPGITAKNKVKVNLNNHDITSTSAGSYGAIMSRGTQEITIYGKGTIDAGDGICIEANGKDSVINLTGSSTVYQNDRSGGELIYCYAGTINISNGTFKNNGDDKTYVLNCYDANYQNGTAKIIVTGGKFYDFNPADNNAEGEHTNFLAEGYHVEISTVTEDEVEHTVYTVKKDA